MPDNTYTLPGGIRYEDFLEEQKNRLVGIKVPDTLYHGSPYKIKKGRRILPKGPIYYGQETPAVHLAEAFKEARHYSKESDTGGINKTRYGKKLEPKIFAQKGYVYKVDTKNQKIFPNHHALGLGEGPLTQEQWAKWHGEYASYGEVAWKKRTSIRYKGKLPTTKAESAVLATSALGSAFYYRHRYNKLERVHRRVDANHGMKPYH